MPESFKEAHTDIPWSSMVGMRNKLIHDYLGVDYESVWKTAKEDIPMLKAKVNALGLKE